MNQLGKEGAPVVLCNFCSKRISVKGISLKKKERGEYCVDFFTCPHCGEAYLVNTTDARQRELLQERADAMQKAARASGFKFRQETIRKHRKEAARAEKELKKRAPELRAVGETILKGGKEGETGGAENGGGGPESV